MLGRSTKPTFCNCILVHQLVSSPQSNYFVAHYVTHCAKLIPRPSPVLLIIRASVIAQLVNHYCHNFPVQSPTPPPSFQSCTTTLFFNLCFIPFFPITHNHSVNPFFSIINYTLPLRSFIILSCQVYASRSSLITIPSIPPQSYITSFSPLDSSFSP